MRSQVLPYDQGAAGFWKDMVQPLQRKLFRVVNELRTNGRENVMARSRQFQSRWLCRPEGALTYANRRNQCGELEQANQNEHPAGMARVHQGAENRRRDCQSDIHARVNNPIDTPGGISGC